jgi:hypothetical protein
MKANDRLFVDSLREMDGNAVTRFFGNARTQIGLNGQLMGSIAEGP